MSRLPCIDRAVAKSACCATAALILCVSTAAAQRNPPVDSLMYERPKFDMPEPLYRFSDELSRIWIAALESPEAELKHRAAKEIAWGHPRGLKTEPFLEPLRKNLADKRRLVRLASARALVEVDVKDAADDLFKISQADGLEISQIVEPALARWDYPAVREVWRARLGQPKRRQPLTVLAVRGLGQVRDAASAETVLQLAIDANQSLPLRMAAAEAVANTTRSGLESAARELADRSSPQGFAARLLAARLLRLHESDEARALLVPLALDAEPGVAAVALVRLYELNPDLVLPHVERLLQSGDANVRSIVAQVLAARPSDSSLRHLGDLLDDHIPKIRTFAGRSLWKLAESEQWKTKVIAEGERMLDSDRWRGMEQSIRLLTELDYAERRKRFVELLDHERPEVYVSAAWGLRRFEKADTLPAVFETAQRRYKGREELYQAGAASWGIEAQLVQLLQLLGATRYAPADSFMRTFVPKNFEMIEARAAAIWALGWLHENQPDDALAAQFSERIKDVAAPQIEATVVRRFSAVALGLMKAEKELPTLTTWRDTESTGSVVGYGCAWAIERITGEPFEKPVAVVRYYTNFFLEALPERPSLR